ncbi:hypothetical protein NL108_003909 [Boleophthalmus pectinirostris]|uniref:interferon-induced protein 44-like n=1 Tax=Boleophthalmus pectinirostris TaxID=150288 RepID=UPI00242FB454|nr:interferon-induced protein 44-like [Boleophthalmus pectinirostris]KAJ0063568.1 hypothetical protein NL108_003909 [Boleophthalmus pectinirostris]
MDESKSFTNEYKTYKIRKDQSDDCFPFVFTDTMGLEPLKDQGIHVEDLVLILKGHVRDGYKFNASSPLTDTNSKFYNPSPAPEDKVHLLVCVLPAHSPTLHSSVIEKIRRMRSVARDLNIPHVAVLTHCDLINTEAKANVQNIFHVKDILDKIREYGADVGFDENHFFPVRNYCMKYHQGNEGMDTLVLSTLKHMLNYADNFIHTL